MSIGAMILTYAICFVPITVIFAILPYIGRKTLTFGVSIPSGEHNNESLRKMRKSFAIKVVVIGLLMSVFSALLFILLDSESAAVWMSGLVLLYIVIISIFYVRSFNAVKEIKKQQGWAENVAGKVVADTKFSSAKRSVSALWFLLYIVIIVGTLLIGIMLYDQIPDKVVMKMDLSGNATRFAEKSFGLIMFAPSIQAVMALVMGFAYWMMQRTPPVIDPDQPEVSSAQNAKFRYGWSAFIVFSGLALLLVFFSMQLWFAGLVAQSLALWTPLAVSSAMVISAVVLSIKMGQSGNRIRVGKTVDGKKINRDDDKYWKYGVFYVNREDPALFVEKRFGVGFTINFGRPAAIIIFVGILAVIAAITILSTSLAG